MNTVYPFFDLIKSRNAPELVSQQCLAKFKNLFKNNEIVIKIIIKAP